MRNMGDVAMLQVAIGRVRSRWPNAKIHVFTTAPDLLHQYTEAIPVDPKSRHAWQSARLLPLRRAGVPRKLMSIASRTETRLRRSSPRIATEITHLLERISPRTFSSGKEFFSLIISSDLVMVAGGGFLADAFLDPTRQILRTLSLAQQLGIPTAVLGQGLGPITDPATLDRMQEVFSKLKLIGLRESRKGGLLLEQLGINKNDDHIFCTGDDAIELAYDARPKIAGQDIGFNLRVAEYSGVGDEEAGIVSTTIREFTDRENVQIRAIPISFVEQESDLQLIRQLIGDRQFVVNDEVVEESPLAIIKEVAKCRVVVSGSYHAAVFALSQGTPVIGLAKSEYYADKFLGLAEQFGVGCEVLMLNIDDLKEKLLEAMNRAWHSANELRPSLLEAAHTQIQFGHAAYAHLHSLPRKSRREKCVPQPSQL